MSRKIIGSGYGGSNSYERRFDSEIIAFKMRQNERYYTMKGFDWGSLDEAGRYEVWSLHIEAGGQPFSYPGFCDFMDSVFQRDN